MKVCDFGIAKMAERCGGVVMPARVIQSRQQLPPRPRSTSFKGPGAKTESGTGRKLKPILLLIVCLSLSLSLSLPLRLSLILAPSPPLSVSVLPQFSPSPYPLSVCLSICISFYLSRSLSCSKQVGLLPGARDAATRRASWLTLALTIFVLRAPCSKPGMALKLISGLWE